MTSMEKSTINDVAKEAGVCKATASRALNGRKEVRPETRERVLNAAKALDYSPDPLSQRLSARKSQKNKGGGHQLLGRLAYLDCPQHRISDLNTAHAISEAGKLGYALEKVTLDSSNATAILRQLWARGVEGLLIRGGNGAFPVLGGEWIDRVPIVLIGEHLEYHVPKVAFDLAGGIELAYEELISEGAHRICFWLIDDGIERSHLRAVGMVMALQRCFQDSEVEILLYTQGSGEVRADRLYSWLQKHPCDALVGPGNFHIEGLCADKPHLKEEIRLVSLYGPKRPGISNLHFVTDRLQAQALKVLTDMLKISSKENQSLLTFYPPEWRV